MHMALRRTGTARDASIATESCVFTYEDSFFNKGPARFGTLRRATCFPFTLTTSKTLAALCFTGSIPFSVVHKRNLRRSLSRAVRQRFVSHDTALFGTLVALFSVVCLPDQS